MSNAIPFEPVSDKDLIAVLTEAIRHAGGGRMTRESELYLSKVCAEHPADRLVLAGFAVMRPAIGRPITKGMLL